MKKYINESFSGERSLFKSDSIEIECSRFHDGESPLKESKNIIVNKCSFEWKYPLWYSENIKVNDTLFKPMSRSGIWYTKNITLTNCMVEAPKEFRRSSKIVINNCKFLDASETLWNCDDIKIYDSFFDGDYLLMNSTNIEINNLHLEGNYICDGAKNVIIKNSILNSKDSFWNSENVTIYDSKINGEYIGWNSKNVTFINCEIESNQGFCYMDNVVLKNCKLINTTLAFEYSTVNADIDSTIDSVKNPISGKITSKGIKKLITDDCDLNIITIITKK